MSRKNSVASNRWGNERSYFSGLGEEDSTSSVLATVTPSGAATRQGGAAPWYESLLKTAVPVLTSAYQQSQMTKFNIARINQGLAPVSASQFAATYQPPSAQVQVGPTATATKLLMFGGVGLLALVGLRAAKVI